MQSLRTEDPLSRLIGKRRVIERRMMPGTVVLACLLLAQTVIGGCTDRQRDAVVPGQHTSEETAAEKSKTPYFYGLIEEYQRILADDPHNLAAIIALGNAYYDAGQWKQAIRHYEQALRLDPSNTDVITDMGTCYRNLGAPARAIAEYERALQREPAHQNALFNLGIVYGHDKKDYATAIKYWERLLHVSPKHPRAEYLQANIAQFKNAMKQRTR